jgi:DNA-binding MarR family transcriptional regulator
MPCAYDLLWELMRAMGRDLHEVAGAEGLTPMQVMLLDRIEDDVAVPMSNLAAQLHCDKSNLTGIVDGLETRGLVERTTPRGDRRVRALVTTEQGREVRGRIGQRLREDNPAAREAGARRPGRVRAVGAAAAHTTSIRSLNPKESTACTPEGASRRRLCLPRRRRPSPR